MKLKLIVSAIIQATNPNIIALSELKNMQNTNVKPNSAEMRIADSNTQISKSSNEKCKPNKNTVKIVAKQFGATIVNCTNSTLLVSFEIHDKSGEFKMGIAHLATIITAMI